MNQYNAIIENRRKHVPRAISPLSVCVLFFHESPDENKTASPKNNVDDELDFYWLGKEGYAPLSKEVMDTINKYQVKCLPECYWKQRLEWLFQHGYVFENTEVIEALKILKLSHVPTECYKFRLSYLAQNGYYIDSPEVIETLKKLQLTHIPSYYWINRSYWLIDHQFKSDSPEMKEANSHF